METAGVMNSDTAVIVAFVLMFGMIATVVGRNKRGIVSRLKNYFTDRRMYADDNTELRYNEKLNTVLFLLIAIVSLGFIAVGSVSDVDVALPDFVSGGWHVIFGIVCVCAAALFVLKSLLYYCVNWVFFSYERNIRWMSSFFLMTSLSAFLLYPLAVLAVFTEVGQTIIIFCLILVSILYEILLFYKLCVNFRVKKYGFLLIFLYFCTVELLPIMTLWHFCENVDRNLIV